MYIWLILRFCRLFLILIHLQLGEEPGAQVVLPVEEVIKGCLYNDAKFSTGMSYYALDCKGPGIPKTLLFETTTNKQIAVLQNNTALRHKVSNMTLPIVRIFDVPLSKTTSSSEYPSTSGKGNIGRVEGLSVYNASIKLFLPSEINVETFMSYPLVVQVYELI